MTTVDEGIARLKRNIDQFIHTLETLPPGAFLREIDDWSPRDIFAHLIGWTVLTTEGCQQIQAGELPRFYEDPGEDYSKVNDRLIEQYDSQDITTLIEQQRAAQAGLIAYLGSLDPGDWGRDFGVEYQGQSETIRDTVMAFAEDYEHHQEQIESWSRRLDE